MDVDADPQRHQKEYIVKCNLFSGNLLHYVQLNK